MNEMVKILDNTEVPTNIESSYVYNGCTVLRVTAILSKCIHNDGLLYWANNLGFKHLSYKKTLNKAATIGTQCHENIDMFLEDNSHTMSEDSLFEAKNAYNSFQKWFADITKAAKVNVIFHERPIVCKYFGGTLDGLYNIDGKLYLIDYKTSNNISYNYYLQLSAYRYMLRTELGINIDGCIILQLSKKNGIAYNEYVLDFSNPQHLDFINRCENTFFSLVYAYYNLLSLEAQYNQL